MTSARRKPGRPATGETPIRHIRVSDDIWLPYLDAVGDEHPEILRQFMAWCARRPGVKRPNRPVVDEAERDTGSTEEE